MFSFCPNTNCIREGLVHLHLEGIEHPKFENQVGSKVSCPREIEKDMNEISIIKSEDPSFLNEDFYVFKEI